eukprot:scaffold6860_cov66-Skeletonema_marinoi.AAC.2
MRIVIPKKKHKFITGVSTTRNNSEDSVRDSIEEANNYALRKIGKNSVYSYFVTDKFAGWLIAFATLGIQIVILIFFVIASEANLQDDRIDIQFTWKCPPDSDVCKDKADLTDAGWVSTVYNSAIATSNTDIIVNSVIVLFIMEMDEWIFSTLEAINEKWTEHAAESGDKSESSDDTTAEKGSTLDEMKNEVELQKAQIAEQQVELDLQKEKVARQSDEIALLRETVQKIQDSIAVAAVTSSDSTPHCAANECVNTHEAESEDTDDTDAEEEEGGTINEMKDQIALREEQITAIHWEEITVTVPCDAEQERKESQEAAAIPDSETVSECVDDMKTEV